MKKNLIIVTGLFALVFSACKTSELTSFDDDIYKNPTEEKQLARAAAEAKAKQEALARAKAQQEALAKKEAEDNNPYYQDPKENADDYYDYKYASRLNRFSNPINGAGYYDSRYTNYYTYNQNPMMYGSSIYSSYNWMPSSQFTNYSMGISVGFGNGFNSFGNTGYYGSFGQPYCCSPFNSVGYGYGYPYYGYSPFNSFGYYDPFYSGYSAGFNQGFYNGYTSGWGYYNSFDPNSGYGQMQYAPRGSNGGSNSVSRGEQARMGERVSESPRGQFLESMAEKQRNTPRFTETNRSRAAGMNQRNDNSGASSMNPSQNNARNTMPVQTNPSNNVEPQRSNRERIMESQSNTILQGPSNSGRSSGSGGNSSGGGSSPRNSGGNSGGGNRPR